MRRQYRKTRWPALILAVLSLPVLIQTQPLGAATIHVPADQSSIQAGIDAAVDGDTVLVANGYFTGPGNRNIDFSGKAITVASAHGASACLIDCQEVERAFVFQGGEGGDSVLQGFTIINGKGYRGGAVLCLAASPTIRDNVFSGCTAQNGGGAISCEEYGADPLITNNLFTGNDGGDQGGAIYLYESLALITRNTFSENVAQFCGAIFAHDRWPTISHNLIVNNTAEDGGGGIGNAGYGCEPLVINNFFYGNSVSSPDVVFGGGAVLILDGDMVLINNTIVGNTAPGHGGAIYILDSSPLISNCIIWGNDSPTGEEIYMDDYYSTQDMLSIRFSDVEGGEDAVVIDPNCYLDWGPGMIDADPLFVSGLQGDHYLSQVAAGEAETSPCVDAGDPGGDMVTGGTRTDGIQDGGVVDMGYHYAVTEAAVRVVTAPGPAENQPPLIRVFLPAHESVHETEFYAYSLLHMGATVAAGDLDGDSADEILTGPGPGEMYGPHIRGFEMDGSPLPGLSAIVYGVHRWGVNVAAGDTDGDGRDEILTGPGPGPVFGPHVRGFDYNGAGQLSPIGGINFLAYGTPRWGVHVAAGDIDGDGYDEIVTGPGPGPVYGPHIRGWNVDGGTAERMPDVSFLAYGTNRRGAIVSCGDVDGDGIAEIVTAPGPGGWFGAHVRGWNYDGAALEPLAGFSFFAWTPNEARYGASLHAGTDLDADGRDDIVVGAGPDPAVGAQVRVFTYDGTITYWFSIQSYSEEWTHGTKVAAGRI